MSLDAVIGDLACPQCEAALLLEGGTVRCAQGHSFDVARSGYVNLLPAGTSPGTADTPAMVAARAAFLGSEPFDPVVEAVAAAAEALAGDVTGCVVDAGAGTGHYLAAVLDRVPGRAGLALDISKHAAKRAARCHPRAGAVVCDTWGRLPVRDGAAAVVLDVFSPRNAAEFARVLGEGGGLVVATPTSAHLAELREPLGLISVDERKTERIGEAFEGRFHQEGDAVVEYALSLDREQALCVLEMGPSARHVGEEERRARASKLAERTVASVSVSVASYRRS